MGACIEKEACAPGEIFENSLSTLACLDSVLSKLCIVGIEFMLCLV